MQPTGICRLPASAPPQEGWSPCQMRSTAFAVALLLSGVAFAICYFPAAITDLTTLIAVPAAVFVATFLVGLYLAHRKLQEGVPMVEHRPKARPAPAPVADAPPQPARPPAPPPARPKRAEKSKREEKAAVASRAAPPLMVRGVGSKPYYTTRIGIANPSAGNCHFNSYCIVMAHAGVGVEELMREEPPVEPLPPPRDLHLDESALEDLKRRQQEISAQYRALRDPRDERNAFANQISRGSGPMVDGIMARVRERILLDPKLYNIYGFIARDDALWTKHWKYPVDREKEFEQESEALKTVFVEPSAEEVALEQELRAVESAIGRDLSRHSAVKAERERERAVEVADYERRVKRREEREGDKQRARETLRILRGEVRGSVSEAEARNLAHFTNHFPGQTCDYLSPTLPDDLRRLLDDPEWRVIRIGGHLHWWTYVRNPDGRTAVEINDSDVGDSFSIDCIQRKWSNPREWMGLHKGAQLHFF